MATENRRSNRFKEEENNKKKMVKQDVSSSSSRRSSRETSSSKQAKEVPVKEIVSNTRKSVRLENKKPPGTPESKEQFKGSQEQVVVSPVKKIDRRKKVVETPASSNVKSKKKQNVKSLKQCVVASSGDKRYETRSLKASGNKRKSGVSTDLSKGLSKRQRIKTEAGDNDNDEESEEKSPDSNLSCSKDEDTDQEKPGSSKAVEDKDDSDDECSDMKDEESTEKASKKERSASRSCLVNSDVEIIDVKDEENSDVEVIYVKEEFIESGDEAPVSGKNSTSERKTDPSDCTDIKDLCHTSSSKDRRTCDVAGLAEIVEKKKGVLGTGTSICIVCKLGGDLRYCEAVGCSRCYHLSCLDPPVNNVPVENYCPFCMINTTSSVPVMSRIPESIWDSREVQVSDAEGLQKQKQYFVKFKGRAHIHNKWVTETQLQHEAPLLVENYSKNGSMKWSAEWTVPHQLLKKRLFLSLKPLYESHQNAGKVLNYQYEFLVQWEGRDYEQATWESENTSVLDLPKGRNLVKEFEKTSASSDDKNEETAVKLPTVPVGCAPGMDNIHLSYVKNLHDAWNKGQSSIAFDGQDRAMRIVLFILSLKDVLLPFLLITTSDSLSQWEAMFLKVATCNALKIFIENTDGKRSFRLLQVHKECGQLAFQILLYPVDAFVKDLNVLKAIKWKAVIVDESQNSEISAHFSHIKSLSTDKRLLVVCGPLGVSMISNLDVLSLLDCDVISKTESDDISKLKETLSKSIAYECKSTSSKFVEFWVPVQISNLQLEQYCSTLLSNAMALSSCSKSDTVGTLHDILVSNRKCCDHPYIVDQSLQGVLTKDLEPIKFLDVGIKASGKLQLLDLILPEMRKRQLRVLILFQPLSGSGKDSASIGDILDDFLRQRFGEDSYERVDGIGMIPSKKQTALSNFNNKEMGRFVFLLEYRACLSSIKLSSVDAIIIFDSDWNPANDLRALQKIAIDSQLEQIMVFRLYTSFTLEEKILRLAENNVTIDSKLQNLSRSTSDALLMWGATHLFKRLSEFHSSSAVNISSEEYCCKELMEEFLNVISRNSNNKDTSKSIITRVQPICGTYGKNLTVTELSDKEEPHTFWKNLLGGRNPCWKYLPILTPRHRKLKRPQYFEESTRKANVGSDEAGRKRKKTASNIIEPVASKPATEDGETALTSGDAIFNETSFQDLLKLKITKLCEVLSLSENVKIMVERFLEYVIENYRVNKEPASTLQAFLISLCWIGSELLKHKLDWKQSVALANEHLNFSCKEDEANSVYLKLEPAKEMFLLHSENQKKTNVSKDSTQVDSFVVKVLDANCTKEVAKESIQENEVQLNPDTVAETSNLQSIDVVLEALSLQPNDEPCSLLSANPTVSVNQSNIPLAFETTAQVSNQAEPNLLNGQSQRSDAHNQQASRMPNHYPDPLQFELEKFCELKNTIDKFHEAIKLKLKSDHEKELEEMIAQMNLKYEAKRQEAETAFQLKKKEIDIGFNRVVRNKILAETYRAKCNDLSPFDPSGTRAIRIEGMQHLPQFHTGLSTGVTSNSPAQSSGSQQDTELQPPLQIVNQTAQLFSTTPNRSPSTMPTRQPSSTFVPTGTPSRPPSTRPSSTTVPTTTTSWPPSTSIPTVTPSRPPSISVMNSTLPSSIQSSTPIKSPSTTVPTPTSSRPPSISIARPPSISIIRPPPSTTTPTATPSGPPSTSVPTSTPSGPPSNSVPTSIPSAPPSNSVHTSIPSRPPSTSFHNNTLIRPPSTTIRSSTPIRSPSTPTSSVPPSTIIPTPTSSGPPSTIIPTPTSSGSPSTSIPASTPTRPPPSITATSSTLSRPPPSTNISTSTPNKPLSSTTVPTTALNKPPSSTTIPTTTPIRPPPGINPLTSSSRFINRPPPNINPINPSSKSTTRPPPNINPSTLLARNPRATAEIRTPAPHIRPFTPSTSVSHRPISSNFPNFLQTSAQPPRHPSLQPPPPFSTSHNGHPTQSSPRSSPLTSSPPLSSATVAPPASFQMPSLMSWLPSEQHSWPAKLSSLPPMPSVSISNTGLYGASAGVGSDVKLSSPSLLKQSALGLLMDIDKQAGLHRSNYFTSSSSDFLDLSKSGQEAGGGGDVVCLSDDD